MTTPQDPYGQPQQPYGQQPYGQPPAAPPLSEGELRGARNLPAPQAVQISFWIWVATAALSLIGAVVAFTQRDAAVATLRSSSVRLPEDQLQAAVTFGLIFAAVLAVVFAGLYLLFAVKARAGRNWARITLAVVTVIRVLFLFTGFSVLSAIGVLAAVVAAVLLFLPASSQFFAASNRR